MRQGMAYELWGEIFGCCRMDIFWTVLQAVVAVDLVQCEEFPDSVTICHGAKLGFWDAFGTLG